jgi:hypothetical protein
MNGLGHPVVGRTNAQLLDELREADLNADQRAALESLRVAIAEGRRAGNQVLAVLRPVASAMRARRFRTRQ